MKPTYQLKKIKITGPHVRPFFFLTPFSHLSFPFSLAKRLSPSGDSGRPESSSLCALRPATPPVLSRRRCRRRIDRCRLPVCSSTSATALVAFRRRTTFWLCDYGQRPKM
uniref:Uncharacterized protein n=1 Tax=Oryza nivara TaxID=4536 RepID=A0A0E0JAN9_ORYNI